MRHLGVGQFTQHVVCRARGSTSMNLAGYEELHTLVLDGYAHGPNRKPWEKVSYPRSLRTLTFRGLTVSSLTVPLQVTHFTAVDC